MNFNDINEKNVYEYLGAGEHYYFVFYDKIGSGCKFCQYAARGVIRVYTNVITKDVFNSHSNIFEDLEVARYSREKFQLWIQLLFHQLGDLKNKE